MDKIIIQGGQRLSGTIPISGAKNAALTLLPCALLTDEPLTLRNLPRLADIDGFQHLMNQFGISTAIAAAVEEQGAATAEIARNVHEAARHTGDVAGDTLHLVHATRAYVFLGCLWQLVGPFGHLSHLNRGGGVRPVPF